MLGADSQTVLIQYLYRQAGSPGERDLTPQLIYCPAIGLYDPSSGAGGVAILGPLWSHAFMFIGGCSTRHLARSQNTTFDSLAAELAHIFDTHPSVAIPFCNGRHHVALTWVQVDNIMLICDSAGKTGAEKLALRALAYLLPERFR